MAFGNRLRIGLERPPTAHAGMARAVNDATTAQIRVWILSGRLRPGEHLHQDHLAAAFGVSRMTVREAIPQLAAEGLAQLVPHRGAFLSSLNPDEILELYEVRATLEGLALKYAIPNVTESVFASLQDILGLLLEAEAVGDDEATIELDRQLHDSLVASAEMPYLHELIQQARRRSEAFRRAHTYVIPGLSASSNSEHAQILAAVGHGETGQAVSLIYEHLYNAASHLIGYLASWEDHNEPMR